MELLTDPVVAADGFTCASATRTLFVLLHSLAGTSAAASRLGSSREKRQAQNQADSCRAQRLCPTMIFAPKCRSSRNSGGQRVSACSVALDIKQHMVIYVCIIQASCIRAGMTWSMLECAQKEARQPFLFMPMEAGLAPTCMYIHTQMHVHKHTHRIFVARGPIA